MTDPNAHSPIPEHDSFRSTLKRRMHWLADFGRLVNSNTDRLCELTASETQKSYFEALTADVLALLLSIRWHHRHAGRVLAPRSAPGTPWLLIGQRASLTRQPLGTVGIIATWNYPVQLLGIQLVSALTAGNRVVVKPSERTSQTQLFLLDLARQALSTADLPPGLIEILPATRAAGQQLLADHDSGKRALNHLVFTGSTAVGRSIASWAAEALVPTTLELSGRDSAIVLADADAKLIATAARSIWHAATTNGGQTCMAPRRVLLMEPIADQFVRAIRPLTAAAPPRTLIDAAAAERCFSLAQSAIALGATPASGVLDPPKGATLRPICLLDCPADCPAAEGDHFGPLIALVKVSTQAELLRLQHGFGQHLSVSVYTGDPTGVRDNLASLLGASQVNINDSLLPTAIPGTSISGAGPSGWGASRGHEGLLAMTRQVCISSTSRRFRTPLDPPDALLTRRFAGLMRWMFK